LYQKQNHFIKRLDFEVWTKIKRVEGLLISNLKGRDSGSFTLQGHEWMKMLSNKRFKGGKNTSTPTSKLEIF
jgi:hypothetical protein